MARAHLTWANLLTLLRIALIPNICYALSVSAWNIALGVFMIASITDIADGWCARIYREETMLGKYLDPIADKLMMISCYSCFVSYVQCRIIPEWFLYLVCCKEITLVTGGIYMLTAGQRRMVSPAIIGKVAMALQVVLITWLLIALSCRWYDPWIVSGIVWITTLCIIGAFSYYAYRIIQRLGVSL